MNRGGGGGGDVDQPPLIMVCEVGKSAQLMWYICVRQRQQQGPGISKNEKNNGTNKTCFLQLAGALCWRSGPCLVGR